jgi:hypothetical protein
VPQEVLDPFQVPVSLPGVGNPGRVIIVVLADGAIRELRNPDATDEDDE